MNLEKFGPKHVLKHFLNICAIPHPSGHEEKVCAYIKDFAEKHNHKYFEDEAGNLLVYVDATPGYEDSEPFLIQAHMDMVPAKVETSNHDFPKDPISLKLVEDRYLYADGTTLGADNAVGMMYMLALMEDDSVIHPPLEMLFTVREEVGLTGIREVDFSKISARRMMNMDCGDPDTMCVSTAGAACCLLKLPVCEVPVVGELMEISIEGLLGGHGGLMIDSGRISAIVAMGRIMCQMVKKVPFNIVYTKSDRLSGIAPEMKAVIAVKEENISFAKEVFEKIKFEICSEYENPEKDLVITLDKYNGEKYQEMLDDKSSERLQRMLYMMPFGVTKRDWEEKETILCSNNTIEVAFKENSVEMDMMVRAPGDAVRDELVDRIEILADLIGAELDVTDRFAGWPYRKDSDLQKICNEAYTELTGKILQVEKENACAETGIILGEIPDMDIVAIAPLSKGAHTPYEYLDLESVEPFWKLLNLMLKKMC